MEEKKEDPSNINSLIFKKSDKVSLENKKVNKNYKDINTYKPTGNLIYSNDLIDKISDSMKK